MYLNTVLGNLLITLLIRPDPHLHTYMCFFLSHLALTDISCSSVTVPKILMNMQTQDQSIPYAEYVTQMYLFIIFACIDTFLLAVMAYDRYVAICQPLCYATTMRKELCLCLLVVCWLLSWTSALTHTLLLAQRSFCADTIILQFFSELSAILKLSCSDTSLNELVIIIIVSAVVIFPLSDILVSVAPTSLPCLYSMG